MGDLVSVVVPTFNRAYCVGRAIDSALAQSHRNLEVVVVDDGSVDGTREFIARDYGAHPRVKYIYQANRGVAAARNTALGLATGDFIAFLDSDDTWKPWKIELQLACMKLLPHIGMIWSDMEAVGPDGTVTYALFLRRMYGAYRWFTVDSLFEQTCPIPTILSEAAPVRGSLFAGDIFSQMVMGNLVHTSTVMLRRDRLEQVGGFDETLVRSGEDYDFHLRTCREGPVGFIDLATISYQTGNPDQLVRLSHWMARNFLTSVTRTLERDKDRINLPHRLQNAVLAHAHAWLAESLIALGDVAVARHHLKCSLQYKPWQPRAAVQLVLCHLRPNVAEAIRGSYRLVHRLVARHASAARS